MNKILFIILFFLFIFPAKGQSIKTKGLSLKDVIEMGLNYNSEIKAANEKIFASKGKFWSGISLPPAEISQNYEFIPTGKKLDEAEEKTLEFKQNFEFPLTYYLRGSKINDEIEISINELQKVKSEITAQIKTAYFNLLAAIEQKHIAWENAKLTEEFFKKAEIRYKIGEGTNLERLTARVQLTEAENKLKVQNNLIISASSQLNLLIGLPREHYGSSDNLIDTLGFTPLNITYEEISSKASKYNPQLKNCEIMLKISSKNKSLAWSSLFPGFSISYAKQSISGNTNFYGVSFGISIPLWFLFDQRGQIQEATSNYNIIEEEQNSIKNQIFLKMNNAYNEYTSALNQVELFRNNVLPQAEEMFRIASKSYETGEINYLEFIQSKLILFNFRNDYLSALLAYNNAIASLEQAIGINLLN